ncbi:MAG: peptidyl-prolyl cis-trans isomerase [Coriobacteriia bacterium]|nr:peptidyl-prolyl cis-trans isomerase [Coriobacteriia bacterium]
MENNESWGEFELSPRSEGPSASPTFTTKPEKPKAVAQTPDESPVESPLPSRAELKKQKHEEELSRKAEKKAEKKAGKSKKAEKPKKEKPEKVKKPKKEKPGKDEKPATVEPGAEEEPSQVLFSLGDEPKKPQTDAKWPTKMIIIGVAAIVIAIALSAGLYLMQSAGNLGNTGVAARVNGSAITTKQLDASVEKLKMQNPQIFTANSGVSSAQIRNTLLDELINEQLVTQEAKKRGVDITDAQVNKQIDMIKRQYSTQQQFDEKLKQQGYTLETLKTQLKYQLIGEGITEKLVPDSTVSTQEIQDYYTQHKNDFIQPAGKRVSQIQFALKDEAKAADVLKQLKGGADFATLAQKYSIHAVSAAQGGNIGWTPTDTPLEKNLQEAVNNLGKGAISNVIKSSTGLFILKVTDTREASTKTLEQSQDSIKTTLLSIKRNQARQNLLSDLRKKAKIVIYDKEIKAYREKQGIAADGSTIKK